MCCFPEILAQNDLTLVKDDGAVHVATQIAAVFIRPPYAALSYETHFVWRIHPHLMFESKFGNDAELLNNFRTNDRNTHANIGLFGDMHIKRAKKK